MPTSPRRTSKAHDCDPTSAFGGVIATNRPVSAAMAAQLADIFTEVIVAPGFEPDALERLRAKKNLRLLVAEAPSRGPASEFRPVTGGLLVQSADRVDAPGDDPSSWTLAAGDAVDAVDAGRSGVRLAGRPRSEVQCDPARPRRRDRRCRNGAGQPGRLVPAGRRSRAGTARPDPVAASDAFFPFADGLQVLLDAGVRAVVQPGGSVRDELAIEAAAAAGVAMYFTGTRHFAH